jgi:DNA-binding MarR family transcriptional regulator
MPKLTRSRSAIADHLLIAPTPSSYHQHSKLIRPALAPHGIDGRELAVLNALADQDPLSQQETARRLGIDRTTMVALVDALENKGLVERRPHPEDRRKNVVELTGTGHDTRRRATRASQDAERRFLAALDEDDAKRLKEALRALITARR